MKRPKPATKSLNTFGVWEDDCAMCEPDRSNIYHPSNAFKNVLFILLNFLIFKQALNLRYGLENDTMNFANTVPKVTMWAYIRCGWMNAACFSAIRILFTCLATQF